jgi:hypothetical protein
MNRQTIAELLRRRPFHPFEIELSSGEVHKVLHQEFAFLLRSNLVVGYPNTDRVVHCALLHITRVRMLAAARAR